ncbi:MAG: glycosyltransferase family 39 protein, partial [Gemmataceae bacterium]|nr:glycosyltransferase family 39 protein [Gemmataceae bacterium]
MTQDATTTPPTNRMLPTVRTVQVVSTEPHPLSAPASEPARTCARVRAALVALVLLGGGLRVGPLTSDRCLWIDESMLALNLVNRTPAQLFEPLDHNQGAPVGFLLAVKASILAFGPSEWALRLVPFIVSVLGLVAFAIVARKLLPGGAAVLAVALVAVSPHLVSYAGECKQYAGDAAFAVGLLALALGLLDGKGGFGRWAALAVAGAGAVWCSHPATFVLGGIGTAILAQAAVQRNRTRFLASGAVIGCWMASFGACYLLCLKQLGGNKYLT